MKMKRFLSVMAFFVLSACAVGSQPAAKFDIVMKEFEFTPSSFTVNTGQPVVITFQNEGAVEHDFVVEKIDVSSVSTEGVGMGEHHMAGEHSEFDLHISTSAGGTSVLKFTANTPGSYRVLCSVPGHEEAGMVGELIVVEN